MTVSSAQYLGLCNGCRGCWNIAAEDCKVGEIFVRLSCGYVYHAATIIMCDVCYDYHVATIIMYATIIMARL